MVSPCCDSLIFTRRRHFSDRDEQSVAYRFMAKYNEKNLLDEFATKCTEFADSQEHD